MRRTINWTILGVAMLVQLVVLAATKHAVVSAASLCANGDPEQFPLVTKAAFALTDWRLLEGASLLCVLFAGIVGLLEAVLRRTVMLCLAVTGGCALGCFAVVLAAWATVSEGSGKDTNAILWLPQVGGKVTAGVPAGCAASDINAVLSQIAAGDDVIEMRIISPTEIQVNVRGEKQTSGCTRQYCKLDGQWVCQRIAHWKAVAQPHQ